MKLIGIDPGIVDTGAVCLTLDEDQCQVTVDWLTINKATLVTGPQLLTEWIDCNKMGLAGVFVEKYNPRPGMPTNSKMVELEHAIRSAIPFAKFINNMGIKQIITRELMELFGVWHFTQVTHHQDLRSAARIALYGAVKDDQLNEVIADVVHAKLYGKSWPIDRGAGRAVEA